MCIRHWTQCLAEYSCSKASAKLITHDCFPFSLFFWGVCILIWFSLSLYFFFLATPHGMWDLSSLSRGGLGVSLIAQLVKNLPRIQETPVQFPDWEDPPKKS